MLADFLKRVLMNLSFYFTHKHWEKFLQKDHLPKIFLLIANIIYLLHIVCYILLAFHFTSPQLLFFNILLLNIYTHTLLGGWGCRFREGRRFRRKKGHCNLLVPIKESSNRPIFSDSWPCLGTIFFYLRTFAAKSP